MAAKGVSSLASGVDVRDGTTSPSSGRRRLARGTVLRSPRGLLGLGGGDILGDIPSIVNKMTSAVVKEATSVLNDLVGNYRPTSSSAPLGPSPQPSPPSSTGSPGTTTTDTPPQPPNTPPTTQPPTTSPNPVSQTGQNTNPSPQSTLSSPNLTATTEASTASATASPSESGPSPTSTSSTVSSYTDSTLPSISTRPDLWVGSTGLPGTALPPPTGPPNSIYTPPGFAKGPFETGTFSLEYPEPSESPTDPAPYTPPDGAHPRGLSMRAIVGIALGALAFVLCIALCLFLILRGRPRARKRWRRMSVESARWRLKPYSYDDDDSSRPVSSVWTAYGSVSVDPHFERESIADSLDFQFAEKPAPADARTPRGPSPSPSHSPSPAVADTQPLARSSLLSWSSVHTLRPPSLRLPAAASSSSSADLLALAGTEYASANPFLDSTDRGFGRSVSGVSRTTAALGDVQSVEAL